MAQGRLIVLSAPSGTGKTTILKRVMTDLDRISFSVSHTTRKPRSGETDGVDYHFVSRDEFQDEIAQGNFVEWAEVHGNFYGTSKVGIEKQLEQGIDVVLDIDTQGADIIRKLKLPQAVDLFISPPSLSILEERLRGRGTESEQSIATRMENARLEMEEATKYKYLVMNDDLSEAIEMVRAVVLAERASGHRGASGENILLGLRKNEK